MAESNVSSSKKLLDIIKNGGKGLLYSELKFFTKGKEGGPATGKKNGKANGADEATAESLGIHALGVLSRMSRSLDNLWGNIYLKMSRGDKHLLFTGCSRGDGTSFLAFHLSMFLAMEHNLKVLYVDTDIERGARDTILYYPMGNLGLASNFMNGAKLEDLVLDTNIEGFKILPSGAGKIKVSSSNIISRQDLLDDLFNFAKTNFDIIIYDCKPVTLSPLAMSFAKMVNHVFMICRYANSRREVCMQGIERFRQNGVDISGMILNDRYFPIPPVIYDLLK